ncbi:MAG: pyrimidine 5'-nucleotidase [Terricaulis sp.]
MSSARTWVFDLDNTLYPPTSALYDAVGARMTAHIVREVGVDEDRALELREAYLHSHGATVIGLAEVHGVDARAFLVDVHTVDYPSLLAPDAELNALIARIPDRKIVFTNGGGGHALNALSALGLLDHFDAVYDIEAVGLAPKPQQRAYARLIESAGIEPRGSIFIEDTLRNLEPAHALGFTTVLIGAVHPGAHIGYVDHWAHDLKAFLRKALDGQSQTALALGA